MKSGKKGFQISIVPVMIATALLLILCIGLQTHIMFTEYEKYTQGLISANHNVLEMTHIRTHLEEMDSCIRKMLEASDAEILHWAEIYSEQYSQALDRLRALSPPSKSDAYYYCLDLSNMFATYHEKYLLLRDQLKQDRRQIYLNSNYASIKKIGNYIDDELNEAANYFLNIYKDESTLAYQQILISRSRIHGMVSICLLLCALILTASALVICLPIAALRRRMKYYTVHGKDMETSERRLQTAEVASIEQAYLMLIQEIDHKHCVEMELYRQKMNNLEMKNLLVNSELKMLQMQMNPHFLFNALNSIYVLTQIGDTKKSTLMIEQLSEILRYSIREPKQFALLREECRIIDDYISIQQIRFDNRIAYVKRIDESLLECRIPHMILQPLVENAFIHGFNLPVPNARIELEIRRRGDDILICVSDNGAGMQAEQLDSILNHREQADSDREKRIGLDNVLRRIELLYGKNNVHISSVPGKGTRVELSLHGAVHQR